MKIFLLSLFVSLNSFSQVFVEGVSVRKLSGYFCPQDQLNLTGIENFFGILNKVYDKTAVYVFAILFILLFWELIQTFIKKEFRWTEKNKLAKAFGGLIFLGLFLNIMAPRQYYTYSFYDARNPKEKFTPCVKESLNAIYIPKNYLRKTKN